MVYSWFFACRYIKLFYKLKLPILVNVVKYSQIPNQIVEFLVGKYFKKDLIDCLDILHVKILLPGLLHFFPMFNGFVEVNALD